MLMMSFQVVIARRARHHSLDPSPTHLLATRGSSMRKQMHHLFVSRLFLTEARHLASGEWEFHTRQTDLRHRRLPLLYRHRSLCLLAPLRLRPRSRPAGPSLSGQPRSQLDHLRGMDSSVLYRRYSPPSSSTSTVGFNSLSPSAIFDGKSLS